MLAILIHILFGLVGAVLLYVAFFLTETEEGKLQNRMEEFWIKVDDLRAKALSRQAAFLQQVMVTLGSTLDDFFGDDLFSLQSVLVSLCLSFAGLPIVRSFSANSNLERIAWICFALSLVAQPILAADPFVPNVGLLISGAVLCTMSLLQLRRRLSDTHRFLGTALSVAPRALGGMLVAFVFAIIASILFVGLNRWCLRKSSRLRSAGGMSIVLFLNMVLASALLSLLVLQRNDVLRMLILKTHLSVWQLLTLRFMGAASLFPAITALIIVLLMLAALLHRILWPILARPVYAVYRRGVIKQSKLLGTVGILSLSFAWPNNPLILLIGKLIRGS